ncbi:MAG: DegV family protein [Clostridia bacterium]|nr:DegV family protein [Clostridia bacterium]
MKIVTDSSADILTLDGASFASAPLKIITADREFVDDESLDVREMVDYLATYKGRSTTSCPNPDEWIRAFGDEEEIFCVTITSSLSGSFNSANTAAKLYMEKYPDRRVCMIDSLSTGPEMVLIMEKIVALMNAGKTFDEISAEIMEYKKTTGLIFMLESMNNLANNGRVSRLVAKFAGLLNIRVVAKASDKGEIEPLDKPRGRRATVQKIIERLKSLGYKGGKMRIAHCFNEDVALEIKSIVQSLYEKASVAIAKCGGLCSFYAERGGVLIGFEA